MASQLFRRALLAGFSSEMVLYMSSAMAAPTSPPPLVDGASPRAVLHDIPIELAGDWVGDLPDDVAAVLGRTRAACLEKVSLLSDQQPSRLRVDEHREGSPHIWLHTDPPTTAWIVVDVGPRDWCKLAYQFGHELGHVFANSWAWGAVPKNPCQWLEEAIVEAFALRGLTHLALSWEASPPFANDQAFGAVIRSYRDTVLRGSAELGVRQGMMTGVPAWFRANRIFLETHGGVDDARAAVPLLLSMYENDPGLVADIGALNRWPGRAGVPLPEYLVSWTASCAELSAPGRLPAALMQLLLKYPS